MTNNAQGENPITTWETPDAAFKTTFIDCNTNCSVDATGIYGLDVWLYEDPAFTNWQNTIASGPTEDEKTYRDSMSSYTLAIYCNIEVIESNDATGNKSGFGCCLQDLSQDGGGYCIVVNTSVDDIDSKYLTEANFQTVLADPYDLSSIEVPTDKYTGITVFHITDNTTQSEIDAGRPYQQFTGKKIQPWPNSSWAEMYRFELGDKAVGLIYNNDGSNAGKWIDEEMTLNGAFLGLEAIAATAFTCFTYLMLM